MTILFQEKTKGSGINALYYVWSLASNWIGGVVPGTGSGVGYTAAVASDQQVDDISDLTLNSLSLAATAAFGETLYVGGNLTIGALTLTSVGGKGVLLEATNTLGTTPTLTISNIVAATGGTLLAYGTGAVIDDNSATDPGGITYEAAAGGLVYLANAPAASSTLQFYDASSIIALANPGSLVSTALIGVRAGDSLELPGSSVTSVTYGSHTISILTDVGATTFSNVSYVGGPPTDFYVAPGTSGLQRVVFGDANFNQTHAATSGPLAGNFVWSDAANWSGGLIPVAGDVVFTVSRSRPIEIDEPNLNIQSLSDYTSNPGGFIDRYVIVGGSATIAKTASLLGDSFTVDSTVLGSATTPTATFTGDLQGVLDVTAAGAGATATMTNGGINNVAFSANSGGTLVFGSTINAGNSITFYPSSAATVEFQNPGSTIGAGIEVLGLGGSIELPGAAAFAVNISHVALSVQTDAGSFAFTNFAASPATGSILGLVATHDAATGLEKFTFQATANAVSVGISGSGIANGTGSANLGAALTLTVNMTSPVTVNTQFGTPTLSLNDGGVATYTGGSGTNALTFSYTVGVNQNTSDLQVTAFNQNNAQILDGGNNLPDFSAAIGNTTGTVIVLTSTGPVSVATFQAEQAALDQLPSGFTISDTAANIAAALDALNADTHITAINLTDPGAPALTLNFASTLGDTLALGKITNAGYRIDVVDSQAHFAALTGTQKTALNALIATGRVRSSTRTGISGQSYTSTITNYDGSGNRTSIEYDGVSGAPYFAFRNFFSGTNATGYTSTGLDLFYTNQASGLTEVDLDGSGNLVRALYVYAGATPGSQTGFEADYVAGQIAGGLATYLAPAGATYSTFAVEYDNAYQYVGAVYTLNYAGQTYNEAQYSYTAGAQPKLTEATFSGYTGSGGPNVASFFYDNTGASTGSQYSYAGITTQNYTSDTLLYNAANVLIAAQYNGYTNKAFSSQTTFYNSSGVAQEIVRDYTSPASAGSINGQAYNSLERIFNPAFTLLATAYHLDNGGNVYVGAASNVGSPSFGGTGVTANTAELSNTLTGGDWTITGGGTGETFNFAAFFNKAEITDYGAAFGGATDVISFSTQDFADLGTLLADAAPSGGGANTTFTSTATGDKLTLDGVTLSQLQGLTIGQANATFQFHA